MMFTESGLPGVWIIDIEPQEDERGFFARSWCRREFAARGLNPNVVQCNISFNRRKGTVRGMHFQTAPHEEARVVRCTSGSVHDVVIDLRPGSDAYGRWTGTDLTAGNRRMLYVPEGFAHGFQTLEDETEVFYLMSQFFAPAAASGVRWNDPAIAIRWPLPVSVISERDRSYPDLAVRPTGLVRP
jgi:dTDP-4-dehydrorhamnose 3,5-epimerase